VKPIVPLLALVLSACASNQTTGVADPERQSDAEYDLARDSWLRQGKAREALAHTLRALEQNPENADAHHLAALIYLDLCQRSESTCRLAEAEKHCRAALDARHDYREAQNTLGVVLIHANRPAEAITWLRPLTEDILYTTPENAYGNLGWAYLVLGKLDEARDALERAVAAQPRFCVGHYRLGLVHEQKHQPEAAREAFSQALTADPRCGSLQEAYAGRARVLVGLGRLDEARADLTGCLRLDAESKAGKECASILGKLK
jgi:type IV pilus assembly protein PilF